MEDHKMEPEFSIEVRNVYKKYKSDFVLRGLNMTVPKGRMYGLLGPSGCGKTTLLKCIIGKLDADGGTIRLNVKKLREVGFMPQSVALHTDLTVNECFVFYGSIFGITGKALKQRKEELSKLLELPLLNKCIDNCSGGQQRRISLAMSLLNDPQLLLLDEPTVGLDPLLAHRIWCYLKDLSFIHKKTILVTTHYMEEARGLHLVGLMRGGVLLDEKPPNDLINQFNCSSLDDVFVEVIKKKQESDMDVEIPKNEELPKDLVKSFPKLKNDKGFDMNHVKAQIYKNYKWAIRNVLVTLFIVVVPLVSVLLIGWEFGSVRMSKNMAYYNEELHNTTCSDTTAVQEENCLSSTLYSCSFLNIINENHPLRLVGSMNEGLEAVRRGHSYAFLHIPSNFTSSILNRMSFRPFEIDLFADQEKPLEIWTDNTVYQIVHTVKFDLYVSLKKLIEQKSEECGINKIVAQTSMSYRPQYVYGANSTFISIILPLFMTGAAFYMAFVYTSSSLIMEINSGVLERMKFYGITSAEILMANAMVHMIFTVIQNVLSLFTAHVIVGEECRGSIFNLYILLTLSQISGTALATFIHTFDITTFGSNYLGLALVVVIVTTGGLCWPTEAVHWILEPISLYSPVTIISKSYNHVMHHGFGITHPLVYSGIFLNVGWAIGWSVLTAYRVKFCNSKI